jgi:hypothetical protein
MFIVLKNEPEPATIMVFFRLRVEVVGLGSRGGGFFVFHTKKRKKPHEHDLIL